MHWVCPLMLSPLLETLSHGISFVKNVADYDGLEFFIYLKFRKGVH